MARVAGPKRKEAEYRSDETTKMKWWDKQSHPTEDVWKAIVADVNFVREQQLHQRNDWIMCMELYNQGNVSGIEGAMAAAIQHVETSQYVSLQGGQTRFNLGAALVDTVSSMIVHSTAVPIIMSTGADFKTVRKARKKTQILQGQCKEIAAWEQKLAMIDACKVGTGFVFSYTDHKGTVACEHVHPLQTFVEHTDGLSGRPRKITRSKLFTRDELADAYPAQAAEIHAAQSVSEKVLQEYFLSGTMSNGHHVEAYESWYCATAKRKGRHVICVEGATLLDEEWDGYEIEDNVCGVFRYRERDKGFYAQGVIERHIASQARIDKLIARIDRCQDLMSNVILLTPANSQGEPIKSEAYTNQPCLRIPVPGLAKPEIVKFDATNYDLQSQIDIEFQRSLLVEGITSDQAAGNAAPGKSSGVAVRAADDVQSRRLLRPVENFQEACISCARVIARANDEMATKDGKYRVRGRMQRGASTFLETSGWKELMDIGEDDARIEVMPMSALPSTPQGKWAAVQEWIAAGFVDRSYALQIIEFPDVSAYADLENAYIDLAKWQIEQILDGKRVKPDPMQNPHIAANIAQRSYAQLVQMNPPEEIADAMRTFVMDCRDLAAGAANVPAMGAAPPGTPVPPGGPMVPGAGPAPGAMPVMPGQQMVAA